MARRRRAPNVLPGRVAMPFPAIDTLNAYRALHMQERQRQRRIVRQIEPYRKAWTPTDPNTQTYGVALSNAGVEAVNGQYVFDTDHYFKNPYLVVRLIDYPQAGTTSWLIHDGTHNYYVADDASNPWAAAWRLDADGIAPVPNVQLAAIKL